MVDAIAIACLGFKSPTSESLRTDLLLESVDDVMLILAEFRSSWAETGCTIMSDEWTDQRNRTLINFLCILSNMHNVSQIGGCLGQS